MRVARRVKLLRASEAFVEQLQIALGLTLQPSMLAPSQRCEARQQHQERHETGVVEPLAEFSDCHRSSFPQRQHIVKGLKIAKVASSARGSTDRHW